LEFAILLFLTVLILLLLWLLKRQSRHLNAEKDRKAPKEPETGRKAGPGGKKTSAPLKVCLLCGSDLAPGTNLKTDLYPPDGGEGRPLEIIGCPRCAPASPAKRAPGVTPRCPVCKTALKPGQVVYARRVETEGKTQVNVLGCPHCKRRP
jgi:hypothetical protein